MIRVYVTDSQSWEIRGGWGASEGSGAGATAGGARPQTAEIIKTFGERCPNLTVTNNKEKANYVVVLDHEGGKGILTHHNKIAVFNRDGDSVFSHSTVSLGNSVKDACEAIEKDAAEHPQTLMMPTTVPTPGAPGSAMPLSVGTVGTLSVLSKPDGAEIYADGDFVGNAPANLRLNPGKHSIKVNAGGYKDWVRDVTVQAGSETRVIAILEAGATNQSTEPAVAPATPMALALPRETGTIQLESMGTVCLTSNPNGADINIDDSFVGKTPATLKVKPGQHAIRMFKDGYNNWVQWVTVAAGSEVNIMATLTKPN